MKLKKIKKIFNETYAVIGISKDLALPGLSQNEPTQPHLKLL